MRISLTDRDFVLLLWCIFSDDHYKVNPKLEGEDHRRFVKKILRYAENEGFEDIVEDITDFQNVKLDDNEEEKEELERKLKKIVDEKGIFRCPKCDIRTNEKTYETKCVICNTSLLRVGSH